MIIKEARLDGMGHHFTEYPDEVVTRLLQWLMRANRIVITDYPEETMERLLKFRGELVRTRKENVSPDPASGTVPAAAETGGPPAKLFPLELLPALSDEELDPLFHAARKEMQRRVAPELAAAAAGVRPSGRED